MVTSSPWGPEDRALMLAYRAYKATLCRCGEPREVAHHPDMDGYYQVEVVAECHACTAVERHKHEDSKEPVKPVEFYRLVDVRDYAKDPLPPMPPPKTSR